MRFTETMDAFVEEQFSLSTDEEERNQFYDTNGAMSLQIAPPYSVPSGTYRIIDGELYRLLPGAPILDVS